MSGMKPIEIEEVGHKILAGALSEPHEILGVDEDASEDVIRKAAKKLLVAFHPDRYDSYQVAVKGAGDLTQDQFVKIVSAVESARAAMLERLDADTMSVSEGIDAYTMGTNKFNDLLREAVVVKILDGSKGLSIEVDLKMLKFPEHEIHEKLAFIDAWIKNVFQMDDRSSAATPTTFELAADASKLVRTIPLENVFKYFNEEPQSTISDEQRYIVGWILGMIVGDFVNKVHREAAEQAAAEFRAEFMAQHSDQYETESKSHEDSPDMANFFAGSRAEPDMSNFYAHQDSNNSGMHVDSTYAPNMENFVPETHASSPYPAAEYISSPATHEEPANMRNFFASLRKDSDEDPKKVDLDDEGDKSDDTPTTPRTRKRM